MPDDFISLYLKHTEIYESPISFWKWSAYSTIGATLKDHCFLRQGDGFLFANIYVLFLAESSGHRKGRPVDLSETLVNRLNNTKIISGRASVEAILDELARTETNAVTGKVVKSSSAIFYAPELSAGIVANPDALKILTDIYDYKSNPYKSRLRTGPCFNLDRIVFSILGATNESMIREMFDTSVIKGGMLARTFLVFPNEFRNSNSLLDIDPEERKQSLDRVFNALKKITTLVGDFKMNDDAKKEYNDWYNPFRQSYATKKEESGVVGRIHTGVLKIAMILTANDMTLCIQKHHIEKAIDECLGLIPNYSSFTLGKGKSEIGQLGGLMITDLLSAPQNTKSRKDLIRDFWQEGLDGDTLDKLAVTLESAGLIKNIQSRDGLYIALTDSCLERLSSGKKKEKK